MIKASQSERTKERQVALTKTDFVVSVWETLDCESVGARELEQIQLEVARRFGEAPTDSPAAIARMLADEGACLRHPEVLECDSQWRKRKLLQSLAVKLDFSSLTAAAQSFAVLEDLRRELLENDDQRALREVGDALIAAKQDCLLQADSPVIDGQRRAEAKEIASWLGVWLRTPELFTTWLELRRNAPHFRKLFAEHQESASSAGEVN